jgi:2-keto-4-pentenoate hydratase/2-oxohepta-3-ene-1,7-dioic acid hydratase in catechol pathway
LSVIRERVGGGIGRAGQRIRVEEAMGQLFGYTIVNGSLSDLIFDIPTLIATLSSVMTLETGDVIATGAPPGVGIGFHPPRYLRPGDVVEVTIDPIGTLSNPVI